MEYIDNSQVVKILQATTNEVCIVESDKLDQYRSEIVKYKQNDEQYQIWIDFYYNNTSLDFKIKVIEMIDELEVNDRVGTIWIGINSDNIIDK